MDLRSGIVSTANALGISPLDLATAISYETAGTFDPTKAGPTTQWGQHRGLIQFGEPQARQYGVDWNDPVGSQLGPDGAVARYLRSTGVQPGMGLLDIYSAINAGAVGRYNASDANNGGAPGTVRDKVEQQMSAHRAKAADLLGGDFTPVMAGGEGNDTLGTTMATPSQPRLGLLDVFRGDTSFRELLGSGDWRDRAILALEGNTLNPNLGLMAQAQGNIANRREDQKTQQAAAQEAQQRNRTAEWLRANGHGQLADLLLSGGVSARDVLGMIQQPKPLDPTTQVQNYEYARNVLGYTPEEASAWAKSGGVNVNVGDQGPRMGTVPPGYVAVPDPAQPSGFRFEAIAGSEAERAAQQQQQQTQAAETATQNTARLQVEEIGRAKQKIQQSPALTTGILGNTLRRFAGTPAADVDALLDTIGANISFDALNAMRQASPTGGALGQVTERELALLQATAGNLRQSQSAEQLIENLERLERQFDEVVNGPAASRIPAPPQGVPPENWPLLWNQMTPEERALFQ